uniref:Uncharacterized protein n=1 Tax=Odontella aurita TaxID=265563 RepID=A0A7S4HJK9_9STRA|mmetsp:Transcript_11018/g.32642  ORF Transcript_11018/g.32642 Transcript_11018/m.32642 type:complete len:552 (+) Transcript_11018:824-2479(+)
MTYTELRSMRDHSTAVPFAAEHRATPIVSQLKRVTMGCNTSSSLMLTTLSSSTSTDSRPTVAEAEYMFTTNGTNQLIRQHSIAKAPSVSECKTSSTIMLPQTKLPVFTMISPRTKRQIDRIEAVRSLMKNNGGCDDSTTSSCSLPAHSFPYKSFKPNCGIPDSIILDHVSDWRMQNLLTQTNQRIAGVHGDRTEIGHFSAEPDPDISAPEYGLDMDGVDSEATAAPSILRLCGSLHKTSRRCLVRWATRTWHQKAAIVGNNRRAKSCETLQMAFRICLARRELAARRKMFNMQKERQAKALAAEERKKYSGAICLEKYYRQWAQKRKFMLLKLQHLSAVRIQRGVRRMLSFNQKVRMALADASALRIQVMVRAVFAHRKAALLRKILYVNEEIESEIWRTSCCSTNQHFREYGSIYLIGCKWREHKSSAKEKQKDEMKLLLMRTKAAVLIQSNLRVLMTRREYMCHSREKKIKTATRNSSCSENTMLAPSSFCCVAASRPLVGQGNGAAHLSNGEAACNEAESSSLEHTNAERLRGPADRNRPQLGEAWHH